MRAAVFDYGHTLINFAPAEEELLASYDDIRRLLVAEARRELPQAPELVDALSRRVMNELVQSYENRQLEELDIVTMFDNALRAMNVELKREIVRQVVEMEHRALVRRLAREPENLEVIRALRARGLKIGLVSNAHFLPDMMREDIERLGIAELVDDAVFSAEIGVRKPHPAIFRKVLDELGVAPEEAFFVGDRLRDDISGAKDLGMSAILTHQFRQEDPDGFSPAPDLVVQQLPDIMPYVEDRLAQPIGRED